MSFKDIATRLDSWYNALTGLGSALRDKREWSRYLADVQIAPEVLENLYHGNDLAARICEALPSEALRAGYYVSAEDNDPDLSSALQAYDRKLKFRRRLKEAAIWSRVFGGAVIYLGIDDGQPEDQPVNEVAIRSIRWATVLDRRYVVPTEFFDTLEQYGEPEIYTIQRTRALAPMNLHGGDPEQTLQHGARIHASRVLRFDGALTTPSRQAQQQGWSDSVLQKVHEVLRDFGVSWQAIGHLLQDASQGVFKIKNLVEMIAGDQKDLLQSRMQLVDLSRSVARAIMVDADMEEFHRDSYSFQGIPDVMRLFMIRLAAAANMPVIVLMRQAPSGLNATGDADIRLWYDQVREYQEDQLLDPLTRFNDLVFAAQDFEGERPEDPAVKFGSLWQMSDTERAEHEKTTAEKDKTYIDAGVLLPEEIAINRFKARGFSTDTVIDLDAREEMRKAEIELAKEKAGEEPEPPPMPGVPGAPVGEPEPDPEPDPDPENE